MQSLEKRKLTKKIPSGFIFGKKYDSASHIEELQYLFFSYFYFLKHIYRQEHWIENNALNNHLSFLLTEFYDTIKSISKT